MDIQTKKSHKAISLTGVGECVMCRSTFAKYFSTSSYLNWEARMQGYKYTCNTTELFAEHWMLRWISETQTLGALNWIYRKSAEMSYYML